MRDLDIVQRIVCEVYKISLADLLSQRRDRKYTRPRQYAMWLARNCTKRSGCEIGRAFHRDHATILHGVRRVEMVRTRDPEFAKLLSRLKERADTEIEAKRQRLIGALSCLQPSSGQKQASCS